MADPASTLSATTTERVERNEVAVDAGDGEGGSAIGGALRLLVASGPGRLGISLFAAMLAISVYVLVMLLITLGALILARETAAVDLAADRPEEEAPEQGVMRPVFH